MSADTELTYLCTDGACDTLVVLPAPAAIVPVWCAECYLKYLVDHPSQLADPIVFNKVLYALDLRESAEGIGPETIVRRFDDPGPLRTTRLRVVMSMPPSTPDTAVIVHG